MPQCTNAKELNYVKHRKIARVVALSGLSATSVYAAGPFSLAQDQSWDFFNTSSGIGALSGVSPPSQPCWPYPLSNRTAGASFASGCFNTAMGFFALKQSAIGAQNTAVGAGVLYGDSTGGNNTAVGALAMFSTNTGSGNAALGTGALFANTTGKANTATGAYALFFNATGIRNTAIGHESMYRNVSGSRNTATGEYALAASTAGNGNTATGFYALAYNLAGNNNTASGQNALGYSTAGNYNVALGSVALFNNKNSLSTSAPAPTNTSSSYNTAVGAAALYNNTTSALAGYNTAVGYQALYNNAGTGNTAVGSNAGKTLTSGSNNNYIGFGVNAITPTDTYVTVIGQANAAATTYIAGIANSQVTGAQVYVTSSGQLGVLASSERYKTDINPLAKDTEKLSQLRPVSFHLKIDPSGAVQYGLIAEEVDKVYPELVIRDEKGRIQGVRYDELAPMLLNEVQKDHATAATLVAQHAADAMTLDAQAAKIASLEQQLAGIQAALMKLLPKDQPVAQR